MEKLIFSVKLESEVDVRKVEGTRAEEFNGPGSLVINDGDVVVARFWNKIESWSTEKTCE